MSTPLLTDVIPELADELESLLLKSEDSALATQVRQLHIVDRCRCGDDSCAQFYTVPRPNRSWGDGLRTISLDCEIGMLILDVVNDKIFSVEVLDRPELRKKLHQILP